MAIRLKLALAVGLCLLTLSSCLIVAVEKDSRQAELEFRRSREKIASLESHSSSSQKPHRLKLLVYDPEESQMVRISLPLWLVKKGLNQAFDTSDSNRGLDFDFDAQGFSQAIVKMPKGLIAEVWSEREKVLLWLE